MQERQMPAVSMRALIIAFGIAGGLALVGTILGAYNFVAGPIHYPGWVLVLWLLADIVLMAFVLAHVGIYIIASITLPWWSDLSFVPAPAGIAGVFILAGGGALLYDRHFGVYSVVALALVCVMAFIDGYWWYTRKKKAEA